MTFKYLQLMMLLCLIGCYSKQEKQVDDFQRLISKLEIEYSKDYTYVIIPNAGCSGCITEAEQYVRDNLNNYKMKFIMTNFQSEKSVRLKIGAGLQNKSNIYYDKNNLVTQFGFDSIYPAIINIKNKQIIVNHIKP